MSEPEGWRRLHPLSPLIRAGRGLIAIGLVLLPASLGGGGLTRTMIELGTVVLVLAYGFVHWLVTRWRIEDDDLRIETGVLKRSSLRYPLQQIQAIDVVKPGLARLFGLAELRLRMGGATGAHARLAYLRDEEAETLRRRLLALAQGSAAPAETGPERVLLQVPTAKLVASILLSRTGILAERVLTGVIAGVAIDPSLAGPILGSSAAPIIAVGAAFWRRSNGEYRLTVAETPDGLHVRAGFVGLTSETIRPGRVQAARMTEPLFWRPFGWCRLEVDVAGRQRSAGEGGAQRRQLRAVLPVGSRELGLTLLERIIPETPQELLSPPRRARFKSPLRFHYLGWGGGEMCVVTTTGRVARTTVWVPLIKVQSLRRLQGPLQRRLRLATIHLDTAGRNVHASLRDRDVEEADRALAELVELARAARRSA